MIGLTYIMQLDGVTGKQLAERLGVTPSTISQWEKQVRPIAKDRMPQLRKIFPSYNDKYFQKELDEIDKLMLDNAKKYYQISTLSGDDTLAIINERKRLQNEILQNEALIDQQRIFNNISYLFANVFNLKSLTDVSAQRVMIAHFLKLCEIEKKLLTNYVQYETDAVAFRKASENIFNDIKQLSQSLEGSIGYIERLIKYSKN